MDPMVMFPLLMRCLNSYSDQDYKSTCPRSFNDEVVSPLSFFKLVKLYIKHFSQSE